MEKLGKSNVYEMNFSLICSNMLIIGPNHILESKRLSEMVAILGV